MRNYSLILLVLCNVLLFSCKDTDKQVLNHLVKTWLGKKIVFPEDCKILLLGDTIKHPLNTTYNIVSYIDSADCLSCRLQLLEWLDFLQKADSISPQQVSFCFFIHDKNIKHIKILLEADNFNYPVYIDSTDTFNKLNQFPNQEGFQTFLLNKESEIVLIGNPNNSQKIRELYLKTIR